jgi:CubicO group peptidase (beta-lactamase class C family)
MVLGRVIEAVTGMPLRQAVAELVSEPLGLAHTGFGPIAARCAISCNGDSYERTMVATGEPYPIVIASGSGVLGADFSWRPTPLRGDANDGNCYHAFGGVSAHAGLFSDVADLMRFVSYQAGEVEPGWFADGAHAGQALGWRSACIPLDGNHERFMYHTGFTGQMLGFWPGTQTGVVLLTNRLLSEGATPPNTQQLLAVALSDWLPNARTELNTLASEGTK